MLGNLLALSIKCHWRCNGQGNKARRGSGLRKKGRKRKYRKIYLHWPCLSPEVVCHPGRTFQGSPRQFSHRLCACIIVNGRLIGAMSTDYKVAWCCGIVTGRRGRRVRTTCLSRQLAVPHRYQRREFGAWSYHSLSGSPWSWRHLFFLLPFFESGGHLSASWLVIWEAKQGRLLFFFSSSFSLLSLSFLSFGGVKT